MARELLRDVKQARVGHRRLGGTSALRRSGTKYTLVVDGTRSACQMTFDALAPTLKKASLYAKVAKMAGLES